jgi:hypothetical protein
MGLGIEIGLESGSGLEGAPRASRRREGGEVRARANLDFRARRPPLPHRATGGLRQRPGGTPARVLVPNAAVRSGGAIGVGRAAAAWLHTRIGARCPKNAPGWCEPRGGCSPAARHGLEIGHKLASGAASGRIGRCPPGQPCAAWPSSRARRTQKAEKIAAPRGVRARAGEGRCPRAVRRSRDDPVRCTAASDAQR